MMSLAPATTKIPLIDSSSSAKNSPPSVPKFSALFPDKPLARLSGMALN